jgi:hypothetical protein
MESGMKITVNVECTPEEARTFLGLPDVTGLNEAMIGEMQARMKTNMAALQPDELMKNWMVLGGQATEHFRKLMTAAATGNKP